MVAAKYAGRLVAAADGSALGNPGPAGWAWYVDEDRWAAGGWAHGTNNMGELMAVLDLLRATREAGPLTILCDSKYVIDSVTKWMSGWKKKGWKKKDGKPVLNLELMQGIDAEMAGRDVQFEWVKGHAGHALNEAADRLANGAAVTYQRGGVPEAGPGLGGASPAAAHAAADRLERAASELDREMPDDLLDEEIDTDHTQGDRDGRRSDDGSGAMSLFDIAAELDGDDVDPDIERVVECERALLSESVRTDPDLLGRLLHPDWSEFGSSGRILDRESTLNRLGPVDIDLEVIEATKLAEGVVLLLWRAHTEEHTRLRSSIWVRDGKSWRQRFHQGTPEA